MDESNTRKIYVWEGIDSVEYISIIDKSETENEKEFEKYLISTGEKELMIIGLQTNFCIDATVKSAFEKGYRVIVPEGANSTFDNKYMDKETTYRYYNEMMWPDRFAECISVSDAADMLRRQ